MTDCRRHSVLALLSLLVATAPIGSCSSASDNTEEAEGGHRRLNWRKRARGDKRRLNWRKRARGDKFPSLADLGDPKTVIPRYDAAAVADVSGPPNIIYIQHESLSGSIALNTEAGGEAMPFLWTMMRHHPDFYVFEHARTVSGNTLDALPALMTGCMPYTQDAEDWLHEPGRSVGYDFRRLGYHTGSFCSRRLDKSITTGHWSVLHDLLVGSMDTVVDPVSGKWPKDNKEGADDRRTLPPFEKWLRELSEKDESRPFYAQFYNFNQHYPYMEQKGAPKSTSRYYQSLATTDEFFLGLFEILEKTDYLKNTIIVGSGDHGEEPFKKAFYARLRAYNSNILQTASYIYYPKHLMPDPSMAVQLRSNTQKMVHTTDFYQTLQGIIRRTFTKEGEQDLNVAPTGCITGVDLAEVNIPEDRVVISWNLYSGRVSGSFKGDYWALSTKKASLYHRKQEKRLPQLKQGKNNEYVLEYGVCTRDTSRSNLCQTSLTAEYMDYFRGAIQWIKDTPLYDEGVKTSQLVEFFGDMVGWKEAT